MISTPIVPGYEVYDVLGQGGYGTVYRARQLAVGREVALKIDSRMLTTERDRRRFLREVTAAGHLSGHPHVVGVHDAGMMPDGRPYLVMELCPGGSLEAVLQRQGPLPAEQVRDIGVRIADALAAAHAAGVLHRDVKPANILVNSYGVVGLSDFGLASILDADGGQSATREALTPAYAAPEAFELADPAPAADVYSLAATLYALLCGHPARFPAGARPSIATIMRLHHEPVPDLPGISPELTGVLRAGLTADPEVRLPSASALRDALAALPLDGLSAGGPGGLSAGGPSGLAVGEPGGLSAGGPGGPGGPGGLVAGGPEGAPRTRTAAPSRRTRVLAITGTALLLAGAVVTWQALAPSGSSSGANSVTSAAPLPGPTSPGGTGAGTLAVAGHPVVSCALTAGIVDSGCPVKPECWGGTFSSSGVLISAEVISCSRPHTWETFAVGAIPSDVVDTGVPHERQTAASPLAQRLCSTAVLGKALTGAASRIPPSAWVVDVMGPTQAKFDAGDHAFRCLARVDGMESSTGTAFSASATPYTTQPPT